jgi:hypothetical protein
MTFAEAEQYVRRLNGERFAGFDDWRLPTVEEAYHCWSRNCMTTGISIRHLSVMQASSGRQTIPLTSVFGRSVQR